MEDADIKQRFHLMQKQIEATVSLTRECRLDLMAAIDSLRIELEVFEELLGSAIILVLRSLIQSQGRGDSGNRSRMDWLEARKNACRPGVLDGALAMCRNHKAPRRLEPPICISHQCEKQAARFAKVTKAEDIATKTGTVHLTS